MISTSPGNRIQFLFVAAGKLLRQLGQGGAAPAGAAVHRSRRRRCAARRRHERGGRGGHRASPFAGILELTGVELTDGHGAEDGFEQAAEIAGVGATETLPAPEFVRVPNHGLITISVMMATIMQAIDSTIANVALPRMQGELSATQDEMGWVLTSYIVAAAITIPLTGWLAGQFGRRSVFLISIFVFTVASALCGMAETLPQIVLFRFVQGVGGAALVPLSQAVLFDINPPKDFGRAMSIWGIGVTMGPILGPALGGWLTEDYNWRWVFFINLPIGMLAFAGLFFTMPENRNAKASRFDFLGCGSLSVTIASLQLMLDRGQLLDWFSSPEIIIEAFAASLSFYIFLVHTFSYPKPFLNPALFKDRNFVASNVFIFLVGVVLFATLALLPPMLQDQMQYPVVLTGLVTAPRGIGTLRGMIVVGRLVMRFDARVIMAVGLALTAYSLWQMTQFSLLMGYWPIVTSGIVQGLGVGLVYVPLSRWPSPPCRPSCAMKARRFSICCAMSAALSAFRW